MIIEISFFRQNPTNTVNDRDMWWLSMDGRRDTHFIDDWEMYEFIKDQTYVGPNWFIIDETVLEHDNGNQTA